MIPDEIVRNHLFDEIATGDHAVWTKTITRDDMLMFGLLSENPGPSQMSGAGMRPTTAAWAGALASAFLTTKYPGPGTLCVSQACDLKKEIAPGDSLTITVTARDKDAAKRSIVFECICVDGTGNSVFSGSTKVIAPAQRFLGRMEAMPEVRFRRRERYEQLIARCRGLSRLRAAVVHPCDGSSITAAVDAANEGILVPILVGPALKIRAASASAGVDIREFQIVDVPNSHAAAEKAVELVRLGQAELLMKGSLHTDEVLGAVVKKDTGLRTERRISHCFVMDVPTYPKALIITDAAVNIFPTLADKVDIVQNAIDLVRSLGLDRPCVAILSAVETVSPKIPSTVDAAALCKMADRGQIVGALLDGPLAFDNAVSIAAAEIKGIRSAVAGRADILVVPDLEAGNMVYKNLSFLADADAAGIVLGARVPIILTSRADSTRTKIASCAVASLYAHSQQRPAHASAAE
jgi:phosphotransacetylase